MDKYDEIAERILDQTCGDNGKMHDGKVSHTRIAGILREAFTEPNPDYCRECGAPAGLHNAGCAARRPSAEPGALREALAQIAKTEQAHCYFEPADSEINDLMQTRHDLRKCGDIARAALDAGKE